MAISAATNHQNSKYNNESENDKYYGERIELREFGQDVCG